jgi:predicted nicotinamide N-methyase
VPSRSRLGSRAPDRREQATVPSVARLRAFVRRETRLRDVPDVPGLRLHQASDVMALWHETADLLGMPDPPLPYWAFTWSGGLAIARFLLEQPDMVRGRRVVDVGAGSALCGLVAARLGAAAVEAIDIDPLAAAAAELNAHANDLAIAVRRSDPLGEEPPDADIILAGDVSYEERMAAGMLDWLRRAAAKGSTVLVGDPGRRYLDPGLQPLANYRVRVSREIEEAEQKSSSVYRVLGAPTGTPGSPGQGVR